MVMGFEGCLIYFNDMIYKFFVIFNCQVYIVINMYFKGMLF